LPSDFKSVDGKVFVPAFLCNLSSSIFLLQGRLVRPPPEEENFQIFYLLRDGLEQSEQEEFVLHPTNDDIAFSSSFAFLGGNAAIGDSSDHRTKEQAANKAKFAEWRRDLARLGINFRKIQLLDDI
jgi:hypothetical protein